ncbi:MAG: DUF115 domain-containing protein [Lentimicrobiaceae bacterium]|nr:DUF115 domain-containing protein [Lentimicrobiaceae bacterium]
MFYLELDRIKRMSKNEITVSRIAKAIFRRIIHIRHEILWILPWGFSVKNKKKLAKYKDIHKGKRCFIIANGPSLKNVNFELLKNEFTFGMNRIYLMKEMNGFKPTYLVCIDRDSQILQFAEEYNQQKGLCFYEWDLKHKFDKKDNFIFIPSKFSTKFSKNPLEEPFGHGGSVAYTCMQLAFYMGFNEVYIIGKDHSYNASEKPAVGIKSTGKEENHFIKGYYHKGQNWNMPDYNTEELAYSLARKAYEDDNKLIMNATENGRLEVFKRVKFETLFN